MYLIKETRPVLHRADPEVLGDRLAQVCERLGGVPFVNVRCLSDLAGGESHLDFGTFLPVAARIASAVVHRLAPEI